MDIKNYNLTATDKHELLKLVEDAISKSELKKGHIMLDKLEKIKTKLEGQLNEISFNY